MAQYKLTYFNLTALGEPIRWLLKYSKIEFEDERINMEDWPSNYKARFPLGQMPLLVEDGKELTQSASIMRYLGKKYGLVAGDEYLDFLVDQVTEIVTDARLQWRTFLMEKDAAKKEEIKQNLLDNICPKYFKQLTAIVEGQGGPFIAGSKLTYGDFVLANWLNIWTNTLSDKLLDDYPALSKQLDAVLAIPEIKQWVADRPKTFV